MDSGHELPYPAPPTVFPQKPKGDIVESQFTVQESTVAQKILLCLFLNFFLLFFFEVGFCVALAGLESTVQPRLELLILLYPPYKS